jgi:hypothetical protein
VGWTKLTNSAFPARERIRMYWYNKITCFVIEVFTSFGYRMAGQTTFWDKLFLTIIKIVALIVFPLNMKED